jgi:hypothetical protein
MRITINKKVDSSLGAFSIFLEKFKVARAKVMAAGREGTAYRQHSMTAAMLYIMERQPPCRQAAAPFS